MQFIADDKLQQLNCEIMSAKKSEHSHEDAKYDTLRNFISSGDDAIVQGTIAKLKLIAHITSDKVLDTKYFTLSEKNLLTSAYRTLIVHNQSRNHAYKFFSETINAAFVLALNYISDAKHKDSFIRNSGEMILAAISETIPGLENHIKAYPDDVTHESDMRSLIAMIEAKLACVVGVRRVTQSEAHFTS